MKRFRIGLRLALLLVALIAVCLGWIGLEAQQRWKNLNHQRLMLRDQIRACETLMERTGQDTTQWIADLKRQLSDLD